MAVWFDRTHIFILIVCSLCSWATFRIYIWQVFAYLVRILPSWGCWEHAGWSAEARAVRKKRDVGLCSAEITREQMKAMPLYVHASAWSSAFGVCYLQRWAHMNMRADVLVWQTVSWLMSSCRTSLFMSPVTHLFSQSTSHLKPWVSH